MAGAAVITSLAAIAPPALAQTETFRATYSETFVGPQGHPACPGDAFACGQGTAAGFGTFTASETFDDTCGCVIRTLTFSDGSTLMLDEAFSGATHPGSSGSSNTSGRSAGHPGLYTALWTVGGGTGVFAGATGSGTDAFNAAGAVGTGVIGGTISIP